MRFYNAEVELKENPFIKEDLKREKERELVKNVCKATMKLYEETSSDKGIVFVTSKDPFTLSMGIKDEKTAAKNFARIFLDKAGLEYTDIKISELSMEMFFDDLLSADRSGLIEYYWEFLCSLGIDELYNRRGRGAYSDRIVDENKTITQIKKETEENFLGVNYSAELNRILKRKTQKQFVGHPAHYLIVSKNGNHRRLMIRNLISALYKKGRIPSKRYTIVGLGDRDVSAEFIDRIYDINEEATVLLKIESEDIDGGDVKKRAFDLDEICKIVKQHCSKTLTIFSVDSASEKIRNKILNALMGISMVDISEDVYGKNDALKIIKSFAERDKLDLDEDVVYKIKNSERTYEFDDLLSVYNKWRHEYLGTQVFTEYKSYVTHENESEKEIKSDAYNELREMIGLTSAKKLIDGAINYFKLQKEYRLRGIEFKRPSMHMVFTGSPGTAKTSVARLVARILKDTGVLSVGNLIELGRADIVGQYVGSTAPLVKDKFQKAKGSVLFIDEAYSLVDDRKGLYGDEAINTIVQEMENHREDTIVIFAGYKKEMQEFLNRNPGLNSRVAFHIPFDDYSSEELLDITKLIAKQTGFSIEENAKAKLLKIFDEARKDESFGNGRYARNLVEKAKFHQADRLIKKDLQYLSDDDMTLLKAEDFELPEATFDSQIKIGFTV